MKWARLWLLVMVVLSGAPRGGIVLAQPAVDPELEARQRVIETGSDLSSGGQRVLFQARGRQEREDFAGAAEVVVKYLEGKPDREHGLLRFNLAVSYLGLADDEQALANLRLAVKAEPDFARAWLRLGEIAYSTGSYAEAAEAFARGHDLSPEKYPEVLYYSGAAWLLADRPERALETMEGLLTGNEDAAPVDWYQVLIAAAIGAEQPQRASRWVDSLLDRHTGDPASWDLAYRFATGIEDYRQAAVCLTVTGYLRPLTRSELFQLGDLYSVIEVPLQAARYYEKALALPAREGVESSRRAEQQERLASAWLAAQENERARDVLNTALAEAPSTRLYALLGDLEYMAGNRAAALAAFARCTEQDPDYGRGWLMMGYCALELDRPEEARRYLDRAAEFPDQAASARGLMGRL
jgi:tetratricopeptide (TPR) repeat protein